MELRGLSAARLSILFSKFIVKVTLFMKRRATQEMRRLGAVTPSSVCFTASAVLDGGLIYLKPI